MTAAAMRIQLSWFPLTSLRAVQRWCGRRKLFYQTLAKAEALDGILSALSILVFVLSATVVAARSLSIIGAVCVSLLAVALLMSCRATWRAALHCGVAAGIVALNPILPWGLTVLVAGNLSAAALILNERRHLRSWWFKPIRLGNTNVGSARLLQGDVEIGHLFLGTHRRRWRESHVRTSMTRVARACRWLTGEGRRYGVRMGFRHLRLAIVDGDWQSDIPNSANRYADLSHFEHFLERQIASVNWPEDESANGSRDTNYCLMVHVAGWTDERAFARPDLKGQSKRGLEVEYVVVGASDSAATLAHELLHVFGADDYYIDGLFDDGWYTGSVGALLDSGRQRFLQRCVMFRTGAPLRELLVDDQTAQKIGWL